MRKFAVLCLAAIGCSAWALVSEQRTTEAQSMVDPRHAVLGGNTAGRPGRGQTASEPSEVVVRQVFDDLFNKGRYELIDTIYASNCLVHARNQSSRLGDALA